MFAYLSNRLQCCWKSSRIDPGGHRGHFWVPKNVNLHMVRYLGRLLQAMLHAWSWTSIRFPELDLNVALRSWMSRIVTMQKTSSINKDCLTCAMHCDWNSMDSIMFNNRQQVHWFIGRFPGFGGSVSFASPADVFGLLGVGSAWN